MCAVIFSDFLTESSGARSVGTPKRTGVSVPHLQLHFVAEIAFECVGGRIVY